MRFASPERLVLLVLPLVVVLVAGLIRHRRSEFAVRFSNLDLLDRVVPARAGWRRVVTVGSLIVGVVLLVVAFARPVVAIPIPRERSAVVLAVDVSLSMAAEDVEPSRIEAARAAARRFVELAPEHLDIGLVAFAGTALPVVVPTDDRAAVIDALDRIDLGRGTAVGEAVYGALSELEVLDDGSGIPPSAIVVLSDGETTVGRPESEAATHAGEVGIPIHTIAFGTEQGSVIVGGRRIEVPVNPRALEDVAAATGGTHSAVASESELRSILESIGAQVAFETEDREVADWFALAGGLAVIAATVGSLLWFGRLEG